MTIHYQIADDRLELRVWDHTQDPDTDPPVAIRQNDGSGFAIPADIKAVMRKAWEDDANLGNSPVMSVYAGTVLMDLVCEDIERVD